MRRISSAVVTPAINFDLTTLPSIKREIDVRTSDTDVYLSSQIPRVSSSIARYCRRIFARQRYLDTFQSYWHRTGHLVTRLGLAHWPLVAIEAVTVNGVMLGEDDFVVDFDGGRLTRGMHWDAGIIEAVYVAGWVLPGWAPDSVGGEPLPSDVEQAAIEMVISNRQTGRLSYTDRDPYVRSETVEGVGTLTYSQTAIGSSSSGGMLGLPVHVKERLSSYVVPVGL